MNNHKYYSVRLIPQIHTIYKNCKHLYVYKVHTKIMPILDDAIR